MTRFHLAAVLALGLGGAVGCSHSAPTGAKAVQQQNEAANALAEIRSEQPGVDGVLNAAAGYAVFPNVGAAGALFVGGAHGQGVLYEGGRVTGFVELNQGSVGLTLGGKTYAQILILHTPMEVAQLKAGKFEVGASVSAVILTAGAGAQGTLDPNTSVIINVHGGLMAGITANGQSFKFAPAAG